MLTISSEVSAQYFDTLIFRTNGLYWAESVIYMGDQNGDGCDDFMITKMDTTAAGSEGKAYFYYGGNPVPDTPVFCIRTYNPLTITACDINRDGYRDIISHRGGMHTYPVSYNVYFGGPNIDSIPDFVIFHPENSISIFMQEIGPLTMMATDGRIWLHTQTQENFISNIHTGNPAG
ncbi:MAG: hypothetical protein IPG53_03415 [Ignavibacteriales bacterium]|nr:hypothetical protein [Ignavibacteriales bacterium]